jgi:hypothetical protein
MVADYHRRRISQALSYRGSTFVLKATGCETVISRESTLDPLASYFRLLVT